MPQWIRGYLSTRAAPQTKSSRSGCRVEHDRETETPEMEYLGDDLEEDLDFEQVVLTLELTAEK